MTPNVISGQEIKSKKIALQADIWAMITFRKTSLLLLKLIDHIGVLLANRLGTV